jgi:hypothetical protein
MLESGDRHISPIDSANLALACRSMRRRLVQAVWHISQPMAHFSDGIGSFSLDNVIVTPKSCSINHVRRRGDKGFPNGARLFKSSDTVASQLMHLKTVRHLLQPAM